MNCPGSVALISRLDLPESDDEDWRVEGVAAHALGAHCLVYALDTWELVGQIFEGLVITPAIAISVQKYVDFCRTLDGPNVTHHIETRVQLPHHPKAFGTADFTAYDREEHTLDVVDYKNGKGIVVEIENNPQLMYYGRGKLEDFPDARKVRLHIFQPNGFHPDGIHRVMEISAEDLCAWADSELLPAMLRTETDPGLVPGEHCRFCPAKLICPLLQGMFRVAARANPERLIELTQQQLDLEYPLRQAVKFYSAALEKEMQRRLQAGSESSTAKLVNQKTNRVWSDGASAIFKARLGAKAMTVPEMRSPAQMEEVDEPGIKDLVHEWAFTPPAGLTVALKSDKRREVKAQRPSETFAGVLTPPSE